MVRLKKVGLGKRERRKAHFGLFFVLIWFDLI